MSNKFYSLNTNKGLVLGPFVIVTPQLNVGGVAEVSLNYYKMFKRNGIDVKIFVLNGKSGSRETMIAEKGDFIFPNIKADKFFSISSPIQAVRTLLNVILVLRQLSKIKGDFIFVHFVSIFCGQLLTIFYPKMTEKKIFSVHTNIFSYAKKTNGMRKFIFELFCRMLCLGDKIVFLTPDVLGKFTEKYPWCDVNKVTVIPNACKFDLDNENLINEAIKDTPDDVNILFSGRLAEGKNILFILDVYFRYRELGGRGKFTIAGDGEFYSKVEKKVSASKYAKDICMLGHVIEMSDVYLNHHTLIMASDFEGFPMVIVEAIYYGLHVVSSNCESGPAFIFEPYKNIPLLSHYSNELGFLLPPPDVSNIDEYALALLSMESKPKNNRVVINKALSFCRQDNVFNMWMVIFNS